MSNTARLFGLLQEGATVITPNNRLSTELLSLFATQGARVQEKPACMPYQYFLQKALKKCSFVHPTITPPLLLNSQQIRHLWRQILTKQNVSFNPGLIDEIQEAWSRCQRWQVDLNHPSFSYTPETRFFQEWAHYFQSALDQLSAITDDQLVSFFLNKQTRFEPTTIAWYCFDDYSPQQLALQHYLQTEGCTILHLNVENDLAAEKFHLFAADDENDEYQQLVNWIKDCMTRGDKRIGVVVPDLQSQARPLQRLLQQHIPSSLFNISLGQNLNEFSLVSHALCWLHLNGETLSNHQARLLLYSPFTGDSQTEMESRAKLLHECAALQEATIDQSVFIKESRAAAPQLVKLLTSLVKYPEEASIKEWIALFTTRLKRLGFPGEYSLSSASYQCYQRFLALFDEFRELGLVTPQLSQTQALAAFETLTTTTIFQAQKKTSTLQILGLLEASGCTFDSLWVARLTDECLPQKTKLSAFIPVILQHENQMPHACPVRELSLATKIIDRFKNSSANGVFSFARLSKDKPNLPCPLLTDLPPFSVRPIEHEDSVLNLENYTENYQLPLFENENVSGGTALLANQAKCPFRAFVAHRLHVKKEIAVADGLNALERGKIIHKVLEILWKNLENQQTLLSLSSSDLDRIIIEAIQIALEPYQRLRKHSFSTIIQAIEMNRLRRLVHAALEWERKRPPFEIESLEQEFTHSIAGMNFNVRIDRLDKVSEGKKWVIDYKSAPPTSLPWKEDRPREPQLLLYALLDETIKTLLFAGLKEGQLTCKGLSEDSLELAGILPIKKDENWASEREHWREQLHSLAEEYRQGYCEPKPVTPSVCQQCDYQSLCRFSVKSA
ncbi:MAG: PD-(D/E)XK nuclease family protein [Legionella sp.]|nr:PD-(D/E)XK nuclease family protein [Legionella sp.]